jgi:mRNA interferase RelE/StbE
MTWRIVLKKPAAKALLGLQPKRAELIREAIGRFAEDPLAPHANARVLVGIDGGVRLRVGDWRVSLVLDAATGEITVFEIAARGSAYRW